MSRYGVRHTPRHALQLATPAALTRAPAPAPPGRPPRRSYQRAPTCDSTVRPRRPAGLRAARDERRAAGDGRRRAPPGRARASRAEGQLEPAVYPVATRPAPARARLACSVPPTSVISRLTVSFDIMDVTHAHCSFGRQIRNLRRSQTTCPVSLWINSACSLAPAATSSSATAS